MFVCLFFGVLFVSYIFHRWLGQDSTGSGRLFNRENEPVGGGMHEEED